MYQKTVVASNRVAATAMIQETSGEQLPTEENGDNIEGYAPEEFAPMTNTGSPLREYIDNINNTLANPILISLDNQTTEEEGRTIEGDALTYPESQEPQSAAPHREDFTNIINCGIDNLALSLLDMIDETPYLEPSDQLEDTPPSSPGTGGQHHRRPPGTRGPGNHDRTGASTTAPPRCYAEFDPG